MARVAGAAEEFHSLSPSTPAVPPFPQSIQGAAGFIGSHAVLRLLEEGYAVTGVDNFSRGNRGAIDVLDDMAAPGQFLFIEMDLGLEADVRWELTERDAVRRGQAGVAAHRLHAATLSLLL